MIWSILDIVETVERHRVPWKMAISLCEDFLFHYSETIGLDAYFFIGYGWTRATLSGFVSILHPTLFFVARIRMWGAHTRNGSTPGPWFQTGSYDRRSFGLPLSYLAFFTWGINRKGKCFPFLVLITCLGKLVPNWNVCDSFFLLLLQAHVFSHHIMVIFSLGKYNWMSIVGKTSAQINSLALCDIIYGNSYDDVRALRNLDPQIQCAR